MPRALRRTLAAVAEGVVPGDAPSADEVADTLAATWEEMQPAGRRALVAMLVALESAALLRTGRRWHRLDARRRTALCDALEHRGNVVQRSAFVGVKTMVLVGYGEDARVQQALGTEGWPPQLLRP
jgi:hypothetical protein